MSGCIRAQARGRERGDGSRPSTSLAVRYSSQRPSPCWLRSAHARVEDLMMSLWKFCFLLAAWACACSSGGGGPAADLVIDNARIWTVDPDQPSAEALAVLGDRIVAVGSSSRVAAWRGVNTRVVDARGRRVLPGFNDSHVHLVQAGEQLANVHLKDAESPETFAQRIGEYATSLPEGEWILGGDWDEQLWENAELPTRELIDEVTPNHPVFIIRYDGHMALANTLALTLAGVDRETRDPPAGSIVRDASGEPTGVLKIAAMDFVREVIPTMTDERRREAALRGLEHAAKLGVTSIHDMTTAFEDIALFMDLEVEGTLTARIYAAPPERRWADLAKVGIKRGFGSSYLRLGALKGFVDGSLGSTTALFFEPYSDAPDTRGMFRPEFLPVDEARARLVAADAAGLQICLHAIGDRGVSTTLDLFEEIQKANGTRDRRFRIEHAQHLVPKDFERFAALDVIASVQPYHAIDDGRWAETRIGRERSKTTYAFRTFLDRGVDLAFGTDWNGAPLEPMWTLHAAVTRATIDGERPDGWVPEQKITLEEALYAYTMGSAYAEFQEREKGSITPGKLADVVMLSEDIFEIAPARWPEVEADMTIVGGRIVYEREGR